MRHSSLHPTAPPLGRKFPKHLKDRLPLEPKPRGEAHPTPRQLPSSAKYGPLNYSAESASADASLSSTSRSRVSLCDHQRREVGSANAKHRIFHATAEISSKPKSEERIRRVGSTSARTASRILRTIHDLLRCALDVPHARVLLGSTHSLDFRTALTTGSGQNGHHRCRHGDPSHRKSLLKRVSAAKLCVLSNRSRLGVDTSCAKSFKHWEKSNSRAQADSNSRRATSAASGPAPELKRSVCAQLQRSWRFAKLAQRRQTLWTSKRSFVCTCMLGRTARRRSLFLRVALIKVVERCKRSKWAHLNKSAAARAAASSRGARRRTHLQC
eukprot:scaffold986_cov237-Pinguiococcus_pyrenoidosus.AAC.22